MCDDSIFTAPFALVTLQRQDADPGGQAAWPAGHVWPYAGWCAGPSAPTAR